MAPPPKIDSMIPARPYEPNAILRWLYGRFFSHIRVDDQWSEAVRTASNRGVVIYIMRSISFLDFLCLDFLVKRFALPLVRFANDLGLWILEPFGKGGRRLRLRRQKPEHEALAQVVRSHNSALLFLRRPPRLGQRARRGTNLEHDLIRTLIDTQRQIDRPILLVPQTFVWSKLPPNKKGSILDLLFGPSEWPGRIRVFFQFLLNYRNASLRSGTAFDLQAFLQTRSDAEDTQLVADKVRYALLRMLERERSIVLGPGKKTPGRIRDELLRSPRVFKHVENEARAKGKSVPSVLRGARRELRRLCADQNPYVLGVFRRLLDRLWNRIYDGLEVDVEGLRKVRAAAREGSLILLPSHKSHIDYLVLSDVMYQHAMSPPLVAAGDNLSFWPLGPILRKGGAFFIRRSFKGRKLYAALVDAYMRKLLVERFHIEFFLEGGRSRTGKLLPPKFGLLSMVIDAALMLPGRTIHFVPVSIGYERIIEQRSYVDEAQGGEKQKENLGGLLRTPRVLRSRYGRLYIQFGEPLAFHQLYEEVIGAGAPRQSLPPPKRRALVQRIAHRVVYDINRITVVTPAALVASVLLTHRRRGMAHQELVAGAHRSAAFLRRAGARFANSLASADGSVQEQAILESILLFVDGKLVTRHGEGEDAIYAVPDERRMALEYYKNNVLHFFVPSALISAAVMASDDETTRVDALRDRVRRLSKLFKYEFMYRADTDFDQIFDEALASMLEAGELERTEDDNQVRPHSGPGGPMVQFYADMIRTYFETYRLAVHSAETLSDRPLGRREWVRKTMSIGRRMFLAGELELHESLSKLRLDNAVQSLRDYGVIQIGSLDTLEMGPNGKDPAALRALEQQLSASLS